MSSNVIPSTHTPSKVYDKLIADCPTLYRCQYGQRTAIGMQGTDAQIVSLYILYANYGRSSVLYRLNDSFAYFTTTPERLRAAIKTFIHVNLLHTREVGSYSTWDEDAGVYTLVEDEAAAETIAARDADLFMSLIPTKSFIPSDRASPVHEYSASA